MSKAILYTANTTSTAVALGDTIPVGSIVRRYGHCINVNGSTINITESGYYEIDAAATFSGAAAGNVVLTIMNNGVAIAGAEATETITTADTELRSVEIPTVVRVYCCGGANIAVTVSTASTATPTITNFAIRVKKV